MNYMTNPKNIPLNGTWKVTIKAKKALSGLTFSIGSRVVVINGNDQT